MKVSLDQTLLFSWDTAGDLKIYLKNNEKLAYKQTITYNAVFLSYIRTADFVYITDDGQYIYVPTKVNSIWKYAYQGKNSNPLYILVSTIIPRSIPEKIYSIVVNK